MEEKENIAKFLGFDILSNNYYNFEGELTRDLPNFKSDWNWLMKVVEKIEKEFCSTNIHYYSQKQMYSVEFLGFNIEYDNSEYGDNKMRILYDSCIKFINFYNKQKEE